MAVISASVLLRPPLLTRPEKDLGFKDNFKQPTFALLCCRRKENANIAVSRDGDAAPRGMPWPRLPQLAGSDGSGVLLTSAFPAQPQLDRWPPIHQAARRQVTSITLACLVSVNSFDRSPTTTTRRRSHGVSIFLQKTVLLGKSCPARDARQIMEGSEVFPANG